MEPHATMNADVLDRGVAEVIDRVHLTERLRRGDRLRIKLGIDPTGSRLHLGHAVSLRVLRRFQDLGHTAVLIIGDTTASIGDPSGRTETRPPLSETQIRNNLATYASQALTILDRSKTEVRQQSEWFKEWKLRDVIVQASKLSAGWILSHETFRTRMKSGRPLAFHELFYPLLQAYDSIAVKADVEVGGLDQKFNLLTGRELMKAHGQPPQDVVMTKYLIGTDGQKMGKSLGNFIALDEEPFEMFGQIMSLPDEVLRDYFELATDIPEADLAKLVRSGTEARDTKMFLAQTIVEQNHGPKASGDARRRWEEFRQGIVEPGSVALVDIPQGSALEFLIVVRLAKSRSEAQRLVAQGGVKLNGRVVQDWKHPLKPGDTLTVGKKNATYTITG